MSLLLLRAEKVSGEGKIIIEGLIDEQWWHQSQTGLNSRLSRVKEAVGSNALSRADFLVDLVTLFSAILVTVKVSVMTIAWDVRVACYLMFFGWAMVQVLLILLHSKEVEDMELPEVMDFLWEYQRRIRGNWALPLPYLSTYIAALPGFVYFGIKCAALANNPMLHWFWLAVLFFFALSGGFIVCVLVGSAVGYIFGEVLMPFVFLSSVIIGFVCVYHFPLDFMKGLFHIGLPASTALLFFTPANNFNFNGGSYNLNDSDTVTVRVWFIFLAVTNFVVSVGLIVLIVLLYHPSGTNKPLWLEFFG